MSKEGSHEGGDNIKLMHIINVKLTRAHKLYKDLPDVLADGVVKGLPDKEILANAGVVDSEKNAQALQTLRWAKKKKGEAFPGRTEEQNRKNLRQGHKDWAKTHPEDVAEYQRRAAEAGKQARTGRARKYTPEVLAIIRETLQDDGGSYQDVVDRLHEMGIKTNYDQIQDATKRWGINNRTRAILVDRKEKIKKEVLEMVADGKSRSEILEYFKDNHQVTARMILSDLGIRDRVDWNKPIIEGLSLRDLAIKIYHEKRDVDTAFVAFNDLLKQHNLKEVSLGAFRDSFPKGVRKRKAEDI